MKLFLPKYPALLKLLYPERLSIVTSNNAIYLTFDDGPVPEVTPWVLDILKDYKAKASFFCIGDNVKKHPDIFRRIIKEDHCVGNHTFNHLNGWKTSKGNYIENIEKAEEFLKTPISESTRLFRPPYGKIKNSQARLLKEHGFKIIMWDVISGDYDQDFSPEDCFDHVVKNATAGSTIVFHDSKKALKNLKEVLPEVLRYYSEKGLEFRSLTDVL